MEGANSELVLERIDRELTVALEGIPGAPYPRNEPFDLDEDNRAILTRRREGVREALAVLNRLSAVPHDGKHSPGDYPYSCLGCRAASILEGSA